MPPKKKAAAKKGAVSDEPGQLPSHLLKTYSDFCKRIGLSPHPEVSKSLTNEENAFCGRQIIIDGGEKESRPESKLGAGGTRALCTSCMGLGEGMPVHPETKQSMMYKQLQELRIWRSNIGDDGAASLAELLRLGGAEIQLQYLELFDNDISSVGAFALGRSLSCMMNRSLLTLSLDYNMTLKSEGVAALCMGIRTNSTLKKLSLRYCDIDENAGGPLGEMLAFTKIGLSILDLMGNRLSGIGLRDMCPGMRRNASLTTLNIADNNLNTTDEDLEGLTKFADVLQNHPTLASVDMQYNRIDDLGGAILVPALDTASKEGGGDKNITTFKPDSSIPTETFGKLFKNGGGGKKGKKGGKKKSDRGLKRDVALLHAAERGGANLNLYKYKYKSDICQNETNSQWEVGVMAQELVAMGGKWAAAVEGDFDCEDGFHLEVDYGKLGLNLDVVDFDLESVKLPELSLSSIILL